MTLARRAPHAQAPRVRRVRRAAAGVVGLAALALAVGLLVAVPARLATAAAAEPVDGALTSGDRVFPRQGNGGYDALHYDLDLSVDVTPSPVPGALATTTIPGAVTTMRARTTGAPLRSFALDLQGLRVSSVRVDGRPAAFRRVETTDVRDVTRDVHKLVVTPSTPVDGEFTTVVRYSGTPVSHTDADGSSEGWNNTVDGATFVNQPVGAMTAFPHNNTPSDKATYDISLDVPTTITTSTATGFAPGAAAAVSNGELVSEIPSDDGLRTTWSWQQREQMASELVIISLGRYDVRRSSITLSDGRVIPEWSFLDSALTDADKARVDARRAQIQTITRGLEKVFGPYPGNSTGVVVDVVPSSISYALETQDRSFFPSVGAVVGDTLTHEVTHQWFGNNVSPVTWNDIWINEGMASWMPGHYNNRLASPPSATTTETAQFTSWNGANPARYAVPPATFTSAAGLYGYQTYSRSAQMWEALKGSIGDAAFFRFLEQWQTRYGGGSRGTADFTALAEEVSGRDLDAFFTDWLRDTDKPAWVQRWVPSLSASTSSAAPGDVVTYTLSAANVGKIPLTSSVGTLDLADVLDDATLGDLPPGLTLAGTTLTWSVPATAVGATATVSFPVIVAAGADAPGLVTTLGSATLGGVCAASCAAGVALPAGPGAVPPVVPPVVTPPVPPATAPVVSPSVQGKPQVGRTLRVRPLAVPPGSTVAYRWKVANRVVATAPRLRIRPSYVGRKVVLVTLVTRPATAPVRTAPVRTKTVLGRVTRA